MKSQSYGSAERACLNGWLDIKDKYYSGGLSESSSTYDAVNKLCVIKDDSGAIKTQFVIWNDNANVVSQVKRLTRENGKTLLLVKNRDADGFWVPLNGGVAKLTQFNGEWLYQDKNDNIEYYNSDGQLVKIDRQGVETVVEYNKNSLPVKIINQSTHQFVNLEYSDDGRIWSIQNGNTGKSLSIYFDVNSNLETMDLEGSIQKNYQYDVDGLLVQREAVTPKGDFITHFEYDQNGRLISQKNSAKNVVVTKKVAAQTKQVVANATPPADIEITVDQIPAGTQVNFYYQSNQLIATDQNGDLSTFTYDLINSKDLVIKKETGGVVQEFNYDAEGNLTQVQSQVASGVTSKALFAHEAENNYQVDLAYNNRNQLIRAEVSSKGLVGKSSDVQRANNSHYVVEYGYQDNRWNRSTLQKVGDRLEILELNQKGQVKAAYKAKLNSYGLKNRSLKSLTSSDYKTTSRTEYNYDAMAYLESVNDNGKLYQLNYKSNGKLKSIVLPNGQKVLRNRLKPSQKSLHDVVDKNKALTQAQVNALPAIGGASVATVIVGGFSDSWYKQYIKDYEARYNASWDVNYSPWWEIDNLRVLGGVTSLSNFDNKNDSILIGHSWGGDAALEYADWNPVDLVVSIDPVGYIYNVGWRAETHINVISDPGKPFSITWYRIRVCRCCCWGCCSSYVWIPIVSSNWNALDWVAFFGGKYTNYFWFPRWGGTDDNIIHRGHHNDFINMIGRVRTAYSGIGLL